MVIQKGLIVLSDSPAYTRVLFSSAAATVTALPAAAHMRAAVTAASVIAAYFLP